MSNRLTDAERFKAMLRTKEHFEQGGKKFHDNNAYVVFLTEVLDRRVNVGNLKTLWKALEDIGLPRAEVVERGRRKNTYASNRELQSRLESLERAVKELTSKIVEVDNSVLALELADADREAQR